MGYMVYTSLTPKRGLFHKLVNPLNHHQEDETKWDPGFTKIDLKPPTLSGKFRLQLTIPIGSIHGMFTVYTHLVDFYGKCRSIYCTYMYLPYMDPIGYHLFNGTLLVSPQLPQPEASQVLPIGLVAQDQNTNRWIGWPVLRDLNMFLLVISCGLYHFSDETHHHFFGKIWMELVPRIKQIQGYQNLINARTRETSSRTTYLKWFQPQMVITLNNTYRSEICRLYSFLELSSS